MSAKVGRPPRVDPSTEQGRAMIHDIRHNNRVLSLSDFAKKYNISISTVVKIRDKVGTYAEVV